MRPEHPFTLEGPCIGTAKGQEDPARLWQMSGTPAMGAAFPPTPPTHPPGPGQRAAVPAARRLGCWGCRRPSCAARRRRAGTGHPARGRHLRSLAADGTARLHRRAGLCRLGPSAPRPRPCATPAAPDQGATAATDWPGQHRPGAAGSCAGREAERVASKRRVRACASARRHWQQCHECIYCAIRDHRCSVRRHHGGVSAEGSSRRRHAG